MTGRLTAISGLGPKEGAAFLVEAAGRRLLLDLGADSDTGRKPDPQSIGRVDAILLSHAHKDHAGALDLRESIGSPAVYASASVLERLKIADGRILPDRGATEVLGIGLETGRTGHALGCLWMRLDLAGGLLYTADYTTESDVLAFDPPPRSRVVILDDSYGDATETRPEQAADLAARIKPGQTLLPVQVDGRGLEIALFLSGLGFRIAVDRELREALGRLSNADRFFAKPGAAEAAAALLERAANAEDEADSADIVLAANATATQGLAASLLDRFAAHGSVIFTGHLPSNTPGAALVRADRAKVRRWNVHPNITENRALAASVAAEKIVNAFGGRDASAGPIEF